MKVAIIYETKRKKATAQVIEWLTKALRQQNVEVTSGKPDEYENLDHDAFIIGSSVYGGKVSSKLLDFIESNKEIIGNKPIAAFVVCKEVEHPREQNLIQILDKLPSEPISEQCFEGYILRKGDFEKQQSKADSFVKKLLTKISS